MIRASGLGKRFGERSVVGGLDLELAKGGLLLLTGPNGSGKTTLLRLLAGLSRPSEGELRVAVGREQVGFVAHEPLVYRQLTPRENLALFARLYRVPAGRPDELLARFGLAQVGDTRADSFSRGMLQRLSLCRALLHDPALLLLDEPFNALDADGQDLLDRELTARDGRTVVVATHEPERLAALATVRLELR